ncbi:MAG: hypothetical protein WCC66_14770 [Rhizobiaceae bacterium]
MFKRIIIGSVMMAAAGVFGVHDRENNHVPVEASVKKVESMCYTTFYEDGDKWKSKEMPCEIVRMAVKADPKPGKYTIHDKTEVTVRFVSPVDKKPHEARIDKAKNDQGKPIKVGDKITVRAHKERAGDLWES